jgi:recombination protein RecT
MEKPVQTANKAVTVQEKNITEEVLNRVNELEKSGELQLSPTYSPANALKSAYLILSETVDKNKKPVLQVCSKPSIANTLLDMVIQGLSPAKKQCYFVAYGEKLQLMRSYMGTVAVTKRLKGIKDVKAYCIYDGDEFEQTYDLNTATLKISKFVPKFENIDINKIKGAFAVVIGESGPVHTEVMSINQIKKSWNQGYAKGKSGAHENFTDQMAKKTVINRACKMYVNTSDDSDVLVQAFNNTDKVPYDESQMVNGAEYEVDKEIKENANKEDLDIKQEKKEEPQHVEAEKVETPHQVKIDPGF